MALYRVHFVDRGNNIYGMHRIEHDADDDAVLLPVALMLPRRGRSWVRGLAGRAARPSGAKIEAENCPGRGFRGRSNDRLARRCVCRASRSGKGQNFVVKSQRRKCPLSGEKQKFADEVTYFRSAPIVDL